MVHIAWIVHHTNYGHLCCPQAVLEERTAFEDQAKVCRIETFECM